MILGSHHSIKSKKKISEHSKSSNEKVREKMSDAHIRYYQNHESSIKGKSLSEEHIEKIRISKRGQKPSEETKLKIRNSLLGKQRPEEVKFKIADSLKGENSPNWKDGISFEPYCIKFNEDFKERVRKYWDRKCVLCNKSEQENSRKLDVHHVDYNKETCCDDSMPLFVVLCKSCHSKTNFNRKYWKEFFIEMINSQRTNGKCFYSKKEMENLK